MEYRVSVVVPVYNIEMYLEECVNSLINQTIDNIEILLIDDGSTDSSGIMCDKYAEKHTNIKVIHKPNGGLGDARNVGARLAKGKYLYFIDSDDFLEKCALKYLFDEAEKKNLDVILFSAECFSDEDISFNKEQYKRTGFLNEVMTGSELFEKLYSIHEYYASIPLRFYKREYFTDKRYSFPDGIHEDEFPGFKSLIDAKRAECIEYKFYKRRYREGSIMTSKKAYNSAIGYLNTWGNILAICKDAPEKNKLTYLKYAKNLFAVARTLYYESFDFKEKEQFKKYRKNLIRTLNSRKIKVEKGDKFFLYNPFLYYLYKKRITNR